MKKSENPNYELAREALYRAIYIFPKEERKLKEIIEIKRKNTFNSLSKTLYSLLPEECKPFMDEVFDFGFGEEKTEGKKRVNVPKYLEEKLWSFIGISWINVFEYNLRRAGIKDREDLLSVISKVEKSWEGIVHFGRMKLVKEDWYEEGDIRLVLQPVNEERRKNADKFFDDLQQYRRTRHG